MYENVCLFFMSFGVAVVVSLPIVGAVYYVSKKEKISLIAWGILTAIITAYIFIRALSL